MAKKQAELEIETVLETISPDKARKYLDGNYGNRVIRQSWVENLAGQMVRGGWTTTHQGIALAADGRLLDGQHRLLAIIRAGKPIEMLVTRNVSPESFRNIDGGRTRSNADRVKLVQDEKENTLAVAIVRAYLVAGVVKSNSAITIDLIDNAFLSMADAFAAVAAEFRTPVRSVTTSSVGAACAVYVDKHPTQGRRFLDGLVSGKDLAARSPILTLRESLIAGRVGVSTHEQYWKSIAATKAHREGRELGNLQAATEDWAGNKYSRRIFERARSAEQATETRRASSGGRRA